METAISYEELIAAHIENLGDLEAISKQIEICSTNPSIKWIQILVRDIEVGTRTLLQRAS